MYIQIYIYICVRVCSKFRSSSALYYNHALSRVMLTQKPLEFNTLHTLSHVNPVRWNLFILIAAFPIFQNLSS